MRSVNSIINPLSAVVALASLCAGFTADAVAAPIRPHVIVVHFTRGTGPVARAADVRAAGGQSAVVTWSHTRLVHLAPGVAVDAALRAIRHRPGVDWAVPDLVAHTASFLSVSPPNSPPPPPPLGGAWIPNDPDGNGTVGGWQQIQWNFTGPFGVNAPSAWRNLINDRHPGGSGVVVAVLDSGIAYRDLGRFRRSPDFQPWQFVRGHDFISDTSYAVDHNGHGTQVAGTIAEATNNGVGVTGLAYGARLMPVRVLDSSGAGDAVTIAAGIVYAVNHGARIINMSLDFSTDTTADEIPELLAAIYYAHRRGVLLVGSAGNEGDSLIDYPARARYVVAVGATTEHGCLASFSNFGPGLDLVAPGGGSDTELDDDPNCQPFGNAGRDVFQETFIGSSVRRFGLPSGYEGTSMAAPHVAATAALIIASGVLGPHPTPEAIVARLKATARLLGTAADRLEYGAGLVDAAAATAPATAG